MGIIEIFLETMRFNNDPKTLLVCIDGLDHILDFGRKSSYVDIEINSPVNPYLKKLSEIKGCEVIEMLQAHHDNGVYKAIDKFISNHFMIE